MKKKQLLAFVMSIFMAVTMVPQSTLLAFAEEVEEETVVESEDVTDEFSEIVIEDETDISNALEEELAPVIEETNGEEEEYKITYDDYGVVYKDGYEKVTKYTSSSEDIILPTAEVMTRGGFTFKGWVTSFSSSEYVTTIPKGSTGDKFFYAKWEGNPIEVKLVAGEGATGVPSTLTYRYGDFYGVLPKPVRAGYTFAGWCTSPKGGTPIAEHAIVPYVEDNVIYAQWDAEGAKFTVTDGSSAENKAKYDVELEGAVRGEDYQILIMPKAGYTIGPETKVILLHCR